jgi:hypothetical protein
VDTNDHTLLQGERLPHFYLLKITIRRASRMITNVLENGGDIQMTTKGTLHTFVAICSVNIVSYK